MGEYFPAIHDSSQKAASYLSVLFIQLNWYFKNWSLDNNVFQKASSYFWFTLMRLFAPSWQRSQKNLVFPYVSKRILALIGLAVILYISPADKLPGSPF